MKVCVVSVGGGDDDTMVLMVRWGCMLTTDAILFVESRQILSDTCDLYLGFCGSYLILGERCDRYMGSNGQM